MVPTRKLCFFNAQIEDSPLPQMQSFFPFPGQLNVIGPTVSTTLYFELRHAVNREVQHS